MISHHKNKIKCSFSGYPIKSSKKDYSGINYISMIVLNLKSTVIPWNSLLNTIAIESGGILDAIRQFSTAKNFLSNNHQTSRP